MVDLLDIADVDEVVEVDGQKLSVPGISGKALAYLLKEYPDIRNYFGGSLDPETLMKNGPDMAVAIMAAGCGHPGNKEAERKIERFSIAVQVDILNAVFRKTLPKNFGPFGEAVGELLNRLNPPTVADRIKAKASSMNSHKVSPPSSDTDTPQPTSGV